MTGRREPSVFVLSVMAEVDMTLGVYSSAERAKAAAGPLVTWTLCEDGTFRGTVEGDRETSWWVEPFALDDEPAAEERS